MTPRRTPEIRELARARLRPGNFQGTAPRGRSHEAEEAVIHDLGVVQKFIYKEPYFDAEHRPDPNAVAAIRERFVATDLYSPHANRRGSVFDLDAAQSGRAGNGDPLAASDLFDLLPSFLSHHPTRRTLSRPMQSARGTGRTSGDGAGARRAM